MAGENRTGRLEKCWATRSRGPRRALRRRRARFPAAPPGGPSGSRVHGRARTRRCRGAPSRLGPAAPELSIARTSCRRCVRAAVSPARVRSRIRMCRKRSFATGGRGRRPACPAVCRIPCRILCFADVKRKRMARRPVFPFVRSARACLTNLHHGRWRQIQLARDGADPLAFIQDQRDGPDPELLTELSSRASSSCA